MKSARLLPSAFCLLCALVSAAMAADNRETKSPTTPTPQYLESVTSAATNTMKAPSGGEGEAAGEIFGQPVSASNYYFAKRVAYMFARPWGAADLPEADRDAFI